MYLSDKMSETAATLGAAGTWIGTAVEIIGAVVDQDHADEVAVTCYADQAGTMYVEQSQDNTNWDAASSVNLAAGDKVGQSFEVVAPYVRGRYVNGGVGQGAFRFAIRLKYT